MRGFAADCPHLYVLGFPSNSPSLSFPVAEERPLELRRNAVDRIGQLFAGAYDVVGRKSTSCLGHCGLSLFAAGHLLEVGRPEHLEFDSIFKAAGFAQPLE